MSIRDVTLYEWLTIAAIVFGPLVGIRVQKSLESWSEKRNRQLRIFKTLMATRATTLNPSHVEALNMIDLEFSDKVERERPVVHAWKAYLGHLASCPKDTEAQNFQSLVAVWQEGSNEYLMRLLKTMAKLLGYEFDEDRLKRGGYMPMGHVDILTEQNLIRKGLIDVLYNGRPVPMEVVRIPPRPDPPQGKAGGPPNLNA